MASSALLRPLSAGATARPGALPRPALPFRPCSFSPRPQTRGRRSWSLVARARGRETGASQQSKNVKESNQDASASATGEEEVEEVEEDLPWIQEKALDLVEFTGTVTQAIPGPRVGQSPLPWLLAVPLAYVGLSFVIAFVKTVKKFTSPKAKRKRLVLVDSLYLNGSFVIVLIDSFLMFFSLQFSSG